MIFGRTISLYLPDGNPQSIKICGFQNSIVKAFSVPRANIDVSEEGINRLGLCSENSIFMLMGVLKCHESVFDNINILNMYQERLHG